MNARESRKGFTLVELLVVIAIIGVLIALLLPAVQSAREAARRAHCLNNLKQVGLGLHNYASSNKDSFPPTAPDFEHSGFSRGIAQPGWMGLILPYMEHQAIFDQIKLDAPWNAGVSGGAVDRPSQPMRFEVIKDFVCPSWPHSALSLDSNAGPSQGQHLGAITTYKGVSGVMRSKKTWTKDKDYVEEGFGKKRVVCYHGDLPLNGLFAYDTARKTRQITDGLSNSYAVSEYSKDYRIHSEKGNVFGRFPGSVRPWIMGMSQVMAIYGGRVIESTPNQLVDENDVRSMNTPMNSKHPGGVNTLLADGSVSFVIDGVDLHLYLNMSTVNGGEVDDEDATGISSGGGRPGGRP